MKICQANIYLVLIFITHLPWEHVKVRHKIQAKRGQIQNNKNNNVFFPSGEKLGPMWCQEPHQCQTHSVSRAGGSKILTLMWKLSSF